MTIKLTGPWKRGFAYDVHTLSSTYLGVDERGHSRFESIRSAMGELVYRLKYQGDTKALARIVKLLAQYKGIETMDYIVPIPPTDGTRGSQPVVQIASALGEKTGVPVLKSLLRKAAGGEQLKNVGDPGERLRLLRKSMSLNAKIDVANKNILLVDDLYRSGSTLSVATKLLYRKGKVRDVFVLTMTKTRSNR